MSVGTFTPAQEARIVEIVADLLLRIHADRRAIARQEALTEIQNAVYDQFGMMWREDD